MLGTAYGTSMIGTTARDRTEKVGMTLPVSLLKQAMLIQVTGLS